MTIHKADTASLCAVAPSYYQKVTEAIRLAALKLLEAGSVTAVIGYLPGRRKGTASPAVVTGPEQASKLIFSPACVNNLSLHLTRVKKGLLKRGRIAIVVKGCDLHILAGLIDESRIDRDDILIIGVACAGVYGGAGLPPPVPLRGGEEETALDDSNLARMCRECTVQLPEGTDIVVGALPPFRQYREDDAPPSSGSAEGKE